jgi:hypothetical protein
MENSRWESLEIYTRGNFIKQKKGDNILHMKFKISREENCSKKQLNFLAKFI